MHHASVIPHEEFVWPPAMFVGEIRMNGKGVQFVDPRAAFFIRHADDVFSMVTEKQTLSASFGMGPDDGMINRRGFAPLRFCHRFFNMPPGSRKIQVVYGASSINALFPARAESFQRAVHITEMRLPTRFRNDFTVNDGCLAGKRTPRAVGMPHQCSFVGIAAIGPAILSDVGQTVQLGVIVSVILVHDVNLYLAEMAGELHLTSRRKILRSEQEDLIAEEGLIDRCEQGIIDALREVYIENPCTEIWRQRAYLKRPVHGLGRLVFLC